jgi:hypothetical protein
LIANMEAAQVWKHRSHMYSPLEAVRACQEGVPNPLLLCVIFF